MISRHFAFACVGALLVAACDDGGDDVVLAPKVPLAYTRFVHAVPDTQATDWRFIDQLENSPTAIGLAFRGTSPYQATAPGARKLRIFPADTNVNVVQQMLIDTTITLTAGTYYTLVHLGNARGNADRLLVIQDDIPNVQTTNVAIRTVHLGTGLTSLDVFLSDTASALPLPSSPQFANLAYASASAYATRAPGAFRLRTTTSGQTSIVANAIAPPGAPAVPVDNLTAIGGSTMGGSAITAFVFPRSVAGSKAPQTPSAFTSPAIVYLIDRHPPRQ
jgi:hypothetical protein